MTSKASTDPFSVAERVARYAEEPPRRVPGYDALHQMASVLLGENAPNAARVLVVGAGGGKESAMLAEAHPEWTIDGVDPSGEMLALARRTVGENLDRVHLIEGVIDDISPDTLYDGAISILTMHFLDHNERLRTMTEIHRRLRPGAPVVVAHYSVPQIGRDRWIRRHVEFCVAGGVARDDAEKGRRTVEEQVPILTPEQDEAILRQAGFDDISLFYASFTFRGWVAYA
ncbi:methyltransferase [Mycobacterium vulneris]|nr:methyltransferase [Mycolicibacterium vulneris]OCB63382.1 methyltransferase [Mycolicibacterium vulneris]